jgi:hypothetical protein
MVKLQNPTPGTAPELPGGSVLALLGVTACFGLIYTVVTVVGIVFYMMWQHRAFWNARAFGNETKFSPGWSVGWWFIPFANLVMAGLVLRDLWRVSAGRGSPNGLPVLIWGVLLGQVVLAITAAVMSNVAMVQGNRSLYLAGSAVGIVNSLLAIVFVGSLALFVQKVQVAQTAGA